MTQNADHVLDHFELFRGPEYQQMLANKKKDLQREESKAKEQDYTGMFKCRKCGKNKVTYTQAQTRSADEPSTFIVFMIAHQTLLLTLLCSDYVLLLHQLWKQVEGLIAIDYLQEGAFPGDRSIPVLM